MRVVFFGDDEVAGKGPANAADDDFLGLSIEFRDEIHGRLVLDRAARGRRSAEKAAGFERELARKSSPLEHGGVLSRHRSAVKLRAPCANPASDASASSLLRR
jgi:hypothetical protein